MVYTDTIFLNKQAAGFGIGAGVSENDPLDTWFPENQETSPGRGTFFGMTTDDMLNSIENRQDTYNNNFGARVNRKGIAPSLPRSKETENAFPGTFDERGKYIATPTLTPMGSGSFPTRGAVINALAGSYNKRYDNAAADATFDTSTAETLNPGSTYREPKPYMSASAAQGMGLGIGGLAGIGALGFGAMAIRRKLAARAAAAAQAAEAARAASTLTTSATHAGAPNAISRLVAGGVANWKPLAGVAAGGYLLNKMFNR